MLQGRAISDEHLVEGARRALGEFGWEGATLERIAEAAGVSRMTLHRRGVSRHGLLGRLARALEDDYRAALWPPLTAPGSGRERLELALSAECGVVEGNLELLEALSGSVRAAVFHEQDPRGLTREVFVEPLRRILTDGVADGSLRATDPGETATVLFNLVGFTYRHLRVGHGWDPKRAQDRVLEIAIEGVAAR
ncbi:MAG: TetR/AcrR family transcriptional regulator [Thermoleophilaceae bacterium]